jgi:DNA-directed RNA polymerase subunit RPC12/RpoP
MQNVLEDAIESLSRTKEIKSTISKSKTVNLAEGRQTRNLTRTKTKEETLLGVRVELEENYDQLEQINYTTEKYYCKNCSQELTDLLRDDRVNHCPYCGLDLIGNRVPMFTRSIDTSKMPVGKR